MFGGMRRNDICLYLGPADRAELQALIINRNTARKLVWRAEIVLATADGHGTFEIMRRARTSKPTVWRWQARYLDERAAGLKRDKTRPSRVPLLPLETKREVIAKTVQETPPNATHWSRALMAEAMGISPSSVGRIWAEAGLKPHLTKGFKVSNDRCSRKRSRISSVSTLIRRIGLWFCVLMRSRRSRRWIGRNPGCRSRRGAQLP